MSMRCLLVDDSIRFLEAARSLLERDGIPVVGVALSGTEALVRATELSPDVVLVDLDLDGESGFDVAVELARSVSCVIILISTHALDDVQELVAGSPARGFLPKSALSARAIRELLGGDGEAPWVSPSAGTDRPGEWGTASRSDPGTRVTANHGTGAAVAGGPGGFRPGHRAQRRAG